MASCYDCIHSEVCSGIGSCSYHCSDVTKCKHFKNKADVVEVVRCKDCKHFFRKLCYNECWGSGDPVPEVQENDFCSYGERKDT